jgi:hypothetical protein
MSRKPLPLGSRARSPLNAPMGPIAHGGATGTMTAGHARSKRAPRRRAKRSVGCANRWSLAFELDQMRRSVLKAE